MDDSEKRNVGTICQFVEVCLAGWCVNQVVSVVQDDPGDGEFSSLGDFDGQQRVVDCSQAKPSDNDQRKSRPGGEIG